MKTTIMKYIRRVGKVLEWAILLVLLAVFFILLSPLLPTKQYLQTYVISTGSMEPTLPVGTVAFTRPIEASQVNEKDIIAFASPLQNDKTIMHRVIEKTEEGGEWEFRTKGDNNNAPDNWIVHEANVKGLMVYQIHYVGHIVSFIKTKVGFAVAIVIPALLLVLSQIKTIKEGIDEEIEKRMKKKMNKTEKIASFILLAILLNGMVLYGTLQAAQALFSAQAAVQGVTISIKDFVPPDVPALVGPSDGSVLKSSDILFDWTDVSDYEDQHNPVYYLFQLGGDSSFSVIHFTSAPLSSSQTSAPAVGDGTYFWRVKACDAVDNCSDWTSGWEISMDDTSPTVPLWVRPADGSSTRQSEHMLFDWTDSSDAHLAGYEYENRKVGGSTWKSVDSCGLLTTSQIPNGQIGPAGSCIVANAATLSTDGVYLRRVRAKDTAGNYSAWSDEWQIRKDATKPTSSVNTFGTASTTDTTIPVSYTASDSGAGVKQVELLYRFNGGLWQSYGTFSSSPINFTVPNTTTSGTYDFYTIAEDQSDDLTASDMTNGSDGDNGQGNIETKSPVVEASIQYNYTAPGNSAGDVVINELMWMGSTLHDTDEWIELRNMTSSSVDLTNWTVENGGSGGSGITLSGTIPAGGYFLITAKETDNVKAAIANVISPDIVLSNMNLLNTGEVLSLKNDIGTVIDSTPTGVWPEGVNGTLKQSMERNSVPGDGTLSGSWHTCIAAGCNDTVYWDTEGNNYGTPKAANLSENDLSLHPANALVTPVESPQAHFYLHANQKEVGFTVSNVERFDTLEYEITYQTEGTLRAIVGSISLTGEDTITRDNLVLGSCSSQGEVCTYDTNITDLSLRIHLVEGASEVILEKSL